MTLKKIEGFDILDDYSKVQKKFYNYNNKSSYMYVYDSGTPYATGIGFANGRYDGTSLVVSHTVENLYNNCAYGPCTPTLLGFGNFLKMPISTFVNGDTHIFGFAFKTDKLMSTVTNFPTTTDAGQAIFALIRQDTEYPVFILSITPNNKLCVHNFVSNAENFMQNSSLVDNSTTTLRGLFNASPTPGEATAVTLSADVWYNIEVKYKWSIGVQCTITVVVNGSVVYTNSVLGFGNVKPESAAFCCGLMDNETAPYTPDQVTATGVGVFSHYFDNFYQCDIGGNADNDFIGGFRVRKIAPSGDDTHQGTVTGAAYRYLAASGNDGDTSYISNTATGQIELFCMTDLYPPNYSGSIRGVEYTFVANKNVASGLKYTPAFKNSAQTITSFGSGVRISGGDWYYHTALIPRVPSNTGVWSYNDLNNGYFGWRFDYL